MQIVQGATACVIQETRDSVMSHSLFCSDVTKLLEYVIFEILGSAHTKESSRNFEDILSDWVEHVELNRAAQTGEQ